MTMTATAADVATYGDARMRRVGLMQRARSQALRDLDRMCTYERMRYVGQALKDAAWATDLAYPEGSDARGLLEHVQRLDDIDACVHVASILEADGLSHGCDHVVAAVQLVAYARAYVVR